LYVNYFNYVISPSSENSVARPLSSTADNSVPKSLEISEISAKAVFLAWIWNDSYFLGNS